MVPSFLYECWILSWILLRLVHVATSNLLSCKKAITHLYFLLLALTVSFMRAGPDSRLHLVSWEPEGRYCHSLCIAIAPFWFSTEHLLTLLMPFWLSTTDTGTYNPTILRHPLARGRSTCFRERELVSVEPFAAVVIVLAISGPVHKGANHVLKAVSDPDPLPDWVHDLNYVRSQALQPPSQSWIESAHCEVIFVPTVLIDKCMASARIFKMHMQCMNHVPKELCVHKSSESGFLGGS